MDNVNALTEAIKAFTKSLPTGLPYMGSAQAYEVEALGLAIAALNERTRHHARELACQFAGFEVEPMVSRESIRLTDDRGTVEVSAAGNLWYSQQLVLADADPDSSFGGWEYSRCEQGWQYASHAVDAAFHLATGEEPRMYDVRRHFGFEKSLEESI